MNYALPSYQRFIPAFFGVLVALFGTLFFLVQQGNKSISVKFFIIYSVITLLLFGVIALEALWPMNEPLTNYIATEVVLVFVGILNTYLMRRYMNIEENESFLPELVFTLYIGFLGAAVLTFLFNYLGHGQNASYALIFASSIIVLLIPFFIYRTFIYLVWMPVAEYKKWYYPVGDNLEIDDDMLDDKKIAILEIEVQWNPADSKSYIQNRVKAPLPLEFGKWYAIWIDNFNERNAGKQVQYCDEYSQPYAWNFYVKPTWFGGIRYVDPDLSISENGLKENDAIVAERIID